MSCPAPLLADWGPSGIRIYRSSLLIDSARGARMDPKVYLALPQARPNCSHLTMVVPICAVLPSDTGGGGGAKKRRAVKTRLLQLMKGRCL